MKSLNSQFWAPSTARHRQAGVSECPGPHAPSALWLVPVAPREGADSWEAFLGRARSAFKSHFRSFSPTIPGGFCPLWGVGAHGGPGEKHLLLTSRSSHEPHLPESIASALTHCRVPSGDAGVALPSCGLRSQPGTVPSLGRPWSRSEGAINAAHAQSVWRQGGPRVPSGHHTAGTNVPGL